MPPYLSGYRISESELLTASKRYGLFTDDDGDELSVWYYLQKINPWMYGCKFEVMLGEYQVRFMLATKKSETDTGLVEETDDISLKEKLLDVGIPIRERIVLDNPPLLR
ncbi:hypothetical protein BDV93DRAFT_528377 [Ceratobasidium sp. AG-I]|nr:hypothetical protein BDV93DRAFT_528377 [Ceratobasidium sp. AG-I]